MDVKCSLPMGFKDLARVLCRHPCAPSFMLYAADFSH